MEHNIGFVPFSPIASGLLSGKITAETRFDTNLKLKGKRGFLKEAWQELL